MYSCFNRMVSSKTYVVIEVVELGIFYGIYIIIIFNILNLMKKYHCLQLSGSEVTSLKHM